MHTLKVRAGVRYWEDAKVNGFEDEHGTMIPCRDGDSWCPMIRLDDGVILGWPAGVTADVHYKVCDDGDYEILDINGDVVATKHDSYVPDGFLCPTEGGYGDYVIMSVGPSGEIEGWGNSRRRPRTLAELDDSWTLV